MGGVVADDAVFLEEIAGEQFDVELRDIFSVELDLFGTFRAVTAGDFGGDGFAIGDDVIDEIFADVILNGPDVLAERVVSGFAGLGHEISDVDARSFGASDGAGNFGD